VAIASKAPDHIHGFTLIPILLHGFVFPTASNCFKLVATKNIHFSNISHKLPGVS
jgi:hypothetical protein